MFLTHVVRTYVHGSTLRDISGLAMALVPRCYASFLRGVYNVAEPCSLHRVPISSPRSPVNLLVFVAVYHLALRPKQENGSPGPPRAARHGRDKDFCQTRSPCRPLDCQHGSRSMVRLTVFQLPIASWFTIGAFELPLGFGASDVPVFRPDTRWFCFVVVFVCSLSSKVPLLL